MELIINDKIYKIDKPKLGTISKNISSYGKHFMSIPTYKFKINKISKSEFDSINNGCDIILCNELVFKKGLCISKFKGCEILRKTITSDLGDNYHSIIFQITYDNIIELTENEFKQMKRKLVLDSILTDYD